MSARLNPHSTLLKERELLTKEGSTKSTYHISLDIRGTGMQFDVGDSLGIYAENDLCLVERFLQTFHAKGHERIKDKRSGKEMSLDEFLKKKANLSRLSLDFLKIVKENAQLPEQKEFFHKLLQEENKENLKQYLIANDPLAVLRDVPLEHYPLEDFCAQFSPLLPRFYSVASSPKVHPEEVHLTVALSSYMLSGEQRFGVASHFLCNLAEPGKTYVPAYVQQAHHFRPPSDLAAPIIMIGPGTGVAPFRAFLQERMALNAPGKNWLFFGERNKAYDFFYGDYFVSLERQGFLRLNASFSRDQEEKIYVQHSMYESRAEMWKWICEGAYLYICGDAERMAKDVEKMLRRIAIEVGALSEEEALQLFKNLRKEKRFQLDVY